MCIIKSRAKWIVFVPDKRHHPTIISEVSVTDSESMPLCSLLLGLVCLSLTANSRPGGYDVYRLASNRPISQKKPQAAANQIFVTSLK